MCSKETWRVVQYDDRMNVLLSQTAVYTHFLTYCYDVEKSTKKSHFAKFLIYATINQQYVESTSGIQPKYKYLKNAHEAFLGNTEHCDIVLCR